MEFFFLGVLKAIAKAYDLLLGWWLEPLSARIDERRFGQEIQQQAKKDLLQPTKQILERYHIKEEPMMLAVFDYAVFDTPCIPSRTYGPGVESIWSNQEVITMPRRPLPGYVQRPATPSSIGTGAPR
jgi:hypothetical protein